MSKYIPKIQSKKGQLFDSLFILVLVYISLYIPLLLKSDTHTTDKAATEQVQTWQSLGVSAVEQQQWQKLGYDEKQAAEIINDKFDYTINPAMLVITALVIIGYFVFLLRVSEKEYREVINEKFGAGTNAREKTR